MQTNDYWYLGVKITSSLPKEVMDALLEDCTSKHIFIEWWKTQINATTRSTEKSS
jgi:hypothetical protein